MKRDIINISTIPSNKSNLLPVESAEVVDIILDKSHPKYRMPSDIGAIVFRRIKSDYKKPTAQLSIAHPLNSSHDIIPLKYEIVLIYQSLIPRSGVVDGELGFYYDNIVNVWGGLNNNALPFSTQNYEIENTKSLTNFTGNISNPSVEIKLGEYFKEVNIEKLTPFEGDVIHYGRFGQSIRFGSTNSNWGTSFSSEPITIIRNSKTDYTDRFVEDINKDDSSIWLSSKQLINFDLSSTKYNSFTSNKPSEINKYESPQILLNSGQIVLNSKTDNILLSSNKSISLESKSSVNIESDYIYLYSSKIYIGSKSDNESEPSVLGKRLVDILTNLIDYVLTATYPTPMGPTLTMLPPSSVQLTLLKQQLNQFLSKKIFVS